MTPWKELADESRIHVDFDSPEHQNRWTVAFRIILLIPQLICLVVLEVVAGVLAIIGWFAALVMGRLPKSIALFLTRYLQYSTRVNAYYLLLYDKYPPFTLKADDYPVSVEFHPVRLRRLAVLFRIILLIPANFLATLVINGIAIAAVFIWLIVLITGRMPRSLFEATAASLRFLTRVAGYAYLVSSAYPGELLGDASGSRPRQINTSSSEAPVEEIVSATPVDQVASEPQSSDRTDGEDANSTEEAWTGGPHYAFTKQTPISESGQSAIVNRPGWPAFSSPNDGPSNNLPTQQSAFVPSKSAKAIIVFLLVLGLCGWGAATAVAVISSNGPMALQALSDDHAQLLVGVNQYKKEVSTCNVGNLACAQSAERGLARTVTAFGDRLYTIGFPSGAQASAASLEAATQSFAGILGAMSTASPTTFLNDFSTLQTLGTEFDTDYKLLVQNLIT